MKFKIIAISIILFSINSYALNTKIGQCNLNDTAVVNKLQAHRELIKELFYVNDQLSAIPILLLNTKSKQQTKNIQNLTAKLKDQQKDLTRQLSSLNEEQKWCLLKDLYYAIDRQTYPRDAHQTFLTARKLFKEDLSTSPEAKNLLANLNIKAKQKRTIASQKSADANPYFFNSINTDGLEGE